MVEAVRIINSLAIPAEIVDMLAEAGWDAEKCCNPKLTREEKRLSAGPAGLKHDIEDEDESWPQAKKQKTAAAVFRKESPKGRNSLMEIAVPTGQNDRKSSLMVVKTEEDTQPVHVTESPSIAKPANPMNSSLRGRDKIDTSSSISSRRKKQTSRKQLKRAIDNVNNSLAVISAGDSVKLREHAVRLREHSEKLEDHSNQLQKHARQLQRQDSALTQLRHDNQVLRDCLGEVLIPLSRAVDALRKSSKDDKRALKSAKKRANRGLKEFKSAAKSTEVLEQSFKQLRHVIGAAEGRYAGNYDVQRQETGGGWS
ncbi:hypothetical protein LX36DRAFT_751174 [Colletotrichum falcatum]|nr:hypothetical protein LX36DRAFT_751174 [Colletotrichum falcatum]